MEKGQLMESETYAALVYEHMLLTRYALQDTPRQEREPALDRSATVLLARLAAEGPMTVGELANAFGLDVSTVHRQVAAALKAGLLERIEERKGGAARKHRPTKDGFRRLTAEFAARQETIAQATADWTHEDLRAFMSLTRRFNESVEALYQRPWPRGGGSD